MARVKEMDCRPIEWGDWKRGGGSTAITAELPPAEFSQTDRIVSTLSQPLRTTLIALNVVRGPMGSHVKQLGCPETTITRRIGRTHVGHG